MRFRLQGQMITILGDPSLCRSMVSLKALTCAVKMGGQGILIECGSVEQDEVSGVEQIPTHIQKVLNKYEVFHMPTGLPPQRCKDHAISLKENTTPVSVRPYRYPYVQKQEIEKLVGEMLAIGIIRPIVSPFSSPIFLVKKKDESWRFCGDYRALNEETIPDKFLIPVIDEFWMSYMGRQCSLSWTSDQDTTKFLSAKRIYLKRPLGFMKGTMNSSSCCLLL